MSHRVEKHPDCTLLFGRIPLDVLTSETKAYIPDGVFDTGVARLAGATVAIGTQSGLNAVRDNLLPVYRRKVQRHYAGRQAGNEALEWLASGDQGSSSLVLFHALSGLAPMPPTEDFDPRAHPHDPADLRRCLMMLELVPELRERLSQARSLSPIWARLVDHWAALTELLEDEVPGWRDSSGRAPQTAALIQELISGD